MDQETIVTQTALHWITIRNEVIRRGIASVEATENEPHIRRGALAGFSLVGAMLMPADFEAILQQRYETERRLLDQQWQGEITIETYWEYRTATLQVEHVYERMKILWHFSPLSARAVLDVAAIEAQLMAQVALA